MVFYIHPRGGYNRRLAAFSTQKPKCNVRLILNGPYDGTNDRSLGEFERAVIISGGAGAGFVLSVLEDVLRRRAERGEATDVQVVFSTSKGEHAVWFHEQVAALLTEYKSTGVRINVHVTGGDGKGSVSSNKNAIRSSEYASPQNSDLKHEKDKASSSEGDELLKPTTTTGRPDTRAIVAQAVEGFNGGIGIAVCGPESMLFDVRNAVAGAQAKVGGLGGPGEVYLYSECLAGEGGGGAVRVQIPVVEKKNVNKGKKKRKHAQSSDICSYH